MSSNMELKANIFYEEVKQQFSFLQDYGYSFYDNTIRDQSYYRDTTAIVQYIGETIGIEIYWYFAGARIGVAFKEAKKHEFPKESIFFYYSSLKEPLDLAISRGITLNDFVNYIGECDNPLLLLKYGKDGHYETRRHVNARAKIINENLSGVISGLAKATHELAIDIIKGDSSIFPEIMKYHTDSLKKIYPEQFE